MEHINRKAIPFVKAFAMSCIAVSAQCAVVVIEYMLRHRPKDKMLIVKHLLAVKI